MTAKPMSGGITEPGKSLDRSSLEPCNLRPNPEPWRRHVAEVADTMIACQATLRISHSVGHLVEMARLARAREYGWPRRERPAPSD
jgi:hypothetical protein